MTTRPTRRPAITDARECCIHEAIHSRKMEGIHRDPAPPRAHAPRDDSRPHERGEVAHR